MTLKLGVTSDADLAPLFFPLEAGWALLPSGITSESRTPGELEKGLLDGSLDVAPVSPFTYAAHRDKLMLLPYPIRASDIATDSVFLVSKKRPDQYIKVKVAVSPASATADALLKAIAGQYYGFEPETLPVATEAAALDALNGRSEISLLSGEAAMRSIGWVKSKGLYVEDLTKAWWIMTGTPLPIYLFGVRRAWTESDKDANHLARELMLYFRQALRVGMQQRPTLLGKVAYQTGLPEDVLDKHYQVQKYELNEGHLRGVFEFYRRLAMVRLIAPLDDLDFFPKMGTVAPAPAEPPRRSQPEQVPRSNNDNANKTSRRQEAEQRGIRVIKGGKDTAGDKPEQENDDE
jgi:chorismate dehydratase